MASASIAWKSATACCGAAPRACSACFRTGDGRHSSGNRASGVPGLDEALRSIDADVFHIGPLPYNNLMYAALEAGRFRDVPVVATPCVHFGEAGSDAVSRYYAQPYQIELLTPV